MFAGCCRAAVRVGGSGDGERMGDSEIDVGFDGGESVREDCEKWRAKSVGLGGVVGVL